MASNRALKMEALEATETALMLTASMLACANAAMVQYLSLGFSHDQAQTLAKELMETAPVLFDEMMKNPKMLNELLAVFHDSTAIS